MEYFCYISRTKVDQFFRALAPGDAEEWTEQRTSEHELGVDVSSDWNIAKIVTLFKAGITYGRKGVIQREQKMKLHYVEKLRRVLLEIARDKPIPSLAGSLAAGALDSRYYHHEGSFTVDSPVSHSTADSNTVVTIRSDVSSRTLLLDCSLRFFSEGNEPNGSFHLHSGNLRFFSGKMPLQLASVFILLNQKGSDVIGTPLLLKLSTHTGRLPTAL